MGPIVFCLSLCFLLPVQGRGIPKDIKSLMHQAFEQDADIVSRQEIPNDIDPGEVEAFSTDDAFFSEKIDYKDGGFFDDGELQSNSDVIFGQQKTKDSELTKIEEAGSEYYFSGKDVSVDFGAQMVALVKLGAPEIYEWTEPEYDQVIQESIQLYLTKRTDLDPDFIIRQIWQEKVMLKTARIVVADYYFLRVLFSTVAALSLFLLLLTFFCSPKSETAEVVTEEVEISEPLAMTAKKNIQTIQKLSGGNWV